jgi:hypothetical protein
VNRSSQTGGYGKARMKAIYEWLFTLPTPSRHAVALAVTAS